MRDGAVFNGLAINAGPFFAYEGENWTMEFALEFDGLSAEGVGPDTITYSVFDAAGNVSNTFETVVPEFAEPATGLAKGDPCDVSRASRTSTTNRSPARTLGTQRSAATRSRRPSTVTSSASTQRPSASSSTASTRTATSPSLVFTALDATGTVSNDGAADIADIEFGFDIALPRRTSFGLFTLLLTGGLFGIESELATMGKLALRDDAALDRRAHGRAPGLAVVGAGEACDPDVSVCEAALGWQPHGERAALSASLPRRLRVISFEAGFGDIEGVPTLIFDIVGRDVNADVAQFNMNLYLQDGRFLDIGAIFVRPEPCSQASTRPSRRPCRLHLPDRRPDLSSSPIPAGCRGTTQT